VTGHPSGGKSQVETFNSIGQAKKCNSIEKYPLEISFAQGGVVNDQVIICGGTTTGNSRGAISQCYKLSQNGQWSPLGAGLKKSRSRGAAAPVNIKGQEFLWITGGWDSSDNQLKTTVLVSERNGVVSEGEELPEARSDHCMLALGKYVMVIGGRTDDVRQKSVLVYDTENGFSYKEGPPMNHARSSHSCSTMKSPAHEGRTVAVVAGGWGDGPDSAEILDFDIPGSAWELTAKLPKRMDEGPRMSPSPDGSSVFLTYEKDIFTLICKRGQQCTWQTLPNKLQISRSYHLQFTVPAKTIPTC